MTAGLRTAVKCFLCQATVPYSVDNRWVVEERRRGGEEERRTT